MASGYYAAVERVDVGELARLVMLGDMFKD